MRITAVEEYAVRCLLQLARAGSKVTISRIAESEGLSDENTAKIMGRLRAMNLVRSIRGKDGGYVLARDPEQITIGEVFDGLSGTPFSGERCSRDDCIHSPDCSLRPVWTRLDALMRGFLGQVTLAQLIDSESDVESQFRARPEVAGGPPDLPRAPHQPPD